MTHSREALVLKSLFAKWSGQARLGRGKVSSCLSESRSKEDWHRTCLLSLEEHLESKAVSACCSGFLGKKYFCNGICTVGGE